jgi:hypothetical protein
VGSRGKHLLEQCCSKALAQRLRLLDDQPACGKCVRASGLIYRSQSVRTEKRHAVTAPPRLTKLNSNTPARLYPRLGRTLDKRANVRAQAQSHCRASG